MRIIPRRLLAVGAVTAVLLSGGAAYALSSGPSDDDARAALKTLHDYIEAHATGTPTVTVTVTETASPSETSSSPTSTSVSPTGTETTGPPTTPASSSGTVTLSPPPPPPTSSTATPAVAQWLSGASSRYAANGSFGTWRGEPAGVLGTWSDTKGCSESACSLDYTENKHLPSDLRLDIAVGGVWKGETWAQAAAGNFDARWRGTLNAVKAKTAALGLQPQNVFIRFAHEMNGSWVDWRVPKGQEADFRAAFIRFSNLRYEVFGETNPARLSFSPNDGTSGGLAAPKDLFVARDVRGRRVADVYAIDSYNSWPHRTDATAIWNALNNTSNPASHESHRRLAESFGVPFAISEWGNCGIADECGGGGGESPAYVQQLNRYLRAHAGDVNNPVPGQTLYDIEFNLWPSYALYGDEANQPQTSKAYAELVWGT